MAASLAIDDCRWLVSDAATRWLELAAAGEGSAPAPALAAKLRKDLTPRQTHLVLEQAALRRRGAEKFALAERMFFTPIALEQATDEWIARYKAARFPPAAAMADLCCGIGGDLLALAAHGPTIGVDRDPSIALFAEANLASARRPARGAESRRFGPPTCARSTSLRWRLGISIRTADRPAAERTRTVAHDPPPEVIEALLGACPAGAIKLAPVAEWPADWACRCELEWISRKRECRQLVAWFGALTERVGSRRATILDAEGIVQRAVRGEPKMALSPATNVGRYVYEPDAAVLAAQRTEALAGERGLAEITPGIAYLTGDEPLDDAALAGFKVLDLLPLRVKTVKRWLQQRSVGRLEVKKRGVALDPARFRQELQVAGDNDATLLITRRDGRPTVIAARRLGCALPC